MSAIDRNLHASVDPLPPGCPLKSLNAEPASRGIKADRITFGMDTDPKAGCCVDKIKTGRQGGCCGHIPHEKFVESYKAAVAKEFAKTGVEPVLDPVVSEILAGKRLPESALDPMPTVIQPEKKSLRQWLVWPFRETARLFKWLFVGLWKDAKQIVTRKPVA